MCFSCFFVLVGCSIFFFNVQLLCHLIFYGSYIYIYCYWVVDGGGECLGNVWFKEK
jgi:hypothetical protein